MAVKNETGKTYYVGAKKIPPGAYFPEGMKLPDVAKVKAPKPKADKPAQPE